MNRVWQPLPLPTSPRHPLCQNCHWRREPQSFWDQIRYCTHLDQWWLLGRPPQPPGPLDQGEILSALPDDACEVSSLPTKDPLFTWILLAAMGIGTHAAAHSAVRFCRGGSLFADAGTHGGGSTCQHHVHQTSANPWDLQCKFQLHCEGWGYGHNIYGHCHHLCWEGDP